MKKAKSLTKRNETSVSFPTPLYRRVSKYCNNTRDFMEAEATAEDIELRRRNFEHATWKRANKQKHNWPVLYDAGDLGFCLLDHCSAFGGHWVNRWFDKAEKL
jgi:hypothetical protein